MKMPWPFRSDVSPRESFAVGSYKLDGPVEGLGGLIEFSPDEYAAIGRRFVGEKDYNALPVTLLDRPWEVMVQTVHGRICAIAPYLLAASRRDADRILAETFAYCIEQLGEPVERRGGSALWRTSDGTVMLRSEESAEGFRVGLFLTSRSIRHLQRL